jgi:hypothetical protein
MIHPIKAPMMAPIGELPFPPGVVSDPSETEESETGAGSDSPSIATAVSTPDCAAIALN